MKKARFSKEERTQMVSEAVSHSRGTGIWIKANCPFCPLVLGKVDTDRSLSFNTASTGWHCFRCQTKGYLDKPLEEFHFELTDEQKILAAEARRPPDGYVGLWKPAASGGFAYQRINQYVTSRGVGPDRWEHLQIGGVLTGRYRGRVVVPVLSTDGKDWYGWSARAVAKVSKRERYRFPPIMDRANIIYNAAALLEETDEILYVMEGVFDTFPYLPHACALFGQASPEQLHALSFAKRPVVFVPDGDAWHRGVTMMTALRLLGHQQTGAVRLPPKTDPDEVDTYDVWEAARASIGASFPVRL